MLDQRTALGSSAIMFRDIPEVRCDARWPGSPIVCSASTSAACGDLPEGTYAEVQCADLHELASAFQQVWRSVYTTEAEDARRQLGYSALMPIRAAIVVHTPAHTCFSCQTSGSAL